MSRIMHCYVIIAILFMCSAIAYSHDQHAQDQNEFLSRVCADLHRKKSKRMLLKNHLITFHVGTYETLLPHAKMSVFFVDNNLQLERLFPDMPSSCSTKLRAVCERRKFRGQVGEHLIVPIPHDLRTGGTSEHCMGDEEYYTALLVGLGDRDGAVYERLERLRRAVGYAFHILEKEYAYDVVISMPDSEWCAETSVVAREIITTMMLASYTFDTYFSQKNAPENHYTITLVGHQEAFDAIVQGVNVGMKIGYAVNQARYWSDSPPSVATPRYMAEQAETIAQESNLICTVFDHHQVKALGMGGLTAVAQGSVEPCRFIILEYRCDRADVATVALVGKGVTFDTGGISLKPAASMEEMKHDMAGAAAIMAAMEVLAELQPMVNVIALLPFTENMPSGSATRPGDIVRFYNGVTAEIKNTDAEGRLILADALSYAVKNYRPDVIIDVATLTGSCMQALGKWFAGLMTQHYEVGNRIIESACRSGDRVWVLPLHDDYKPAVRSSVADIANLGLGSYYAGAITAGFFLQHFVGKTPWVHLDIAGTAWDVPVSYYRPGATGFGVRLLIDYLMSWPINV